jgi:hypothetical protein
VAVLEWLEVAPGPGQVRPCRWLWLLPGLVVLVVRVMLPARREAVKNVRPLVLLALKQFILRRQPAPGDLIWTVTKPRASAI